VHLLAPEAFARAEVPDGSEHFVLKPLAPFEVCLRPAERDEELTHESAQRRVALGSLDPGPTVDIVWK
jgi:hypothetical protein